ncbi:MAG: hypothetical protein ACE5NW_05625 [Acidiferrobacterales bacterium]
MTSQVHCLGLRRQLVGLCPKRSEAQRAIDTAHLSTLTRDVSVVGTPVAQTKFHATGDGPEQIRDYSDGPHPPYFERQGK